MAGKDTGHHGVEEIQNTHKSNDGTEQSAQQQEHILETVKFRPQCCFAFIHQSWQIISSQISKVILRRCFADIIGSIKQVKHRNTFLPAVMIELFNRKHKTISCCIIAEAHRVWHCDINTYCIIYIVAFWKLKLHIFCRRIFITKISVAAVDIITFINIGYGLHRAYRRIIIKITHITVIICTDYYSDCICAILEQRRYITLYHSQFIKQGIIQTFNQCTLAHQITTAVFLFQ